MRPKLHLLPLLAALAACTGTPAPDDATPPNAPDLAVCDAGDAQAVVGQQASTQAGARALELTGARQLRWAPPRSALTMDYRSDRLTIEYDDAMIITRVSCG